MSSTLCLIRTFRDGWNVMLRQVGVVESLIRYPVKSTTGERVAHLDVGFPGARGDRVRAVRSVATGQVLTAKKKNTAGLLTARSGIAPDGTLWARMPDGSEVEVLSIEAAHAFSELLGQQVHLLGPELLEGCPTNYDFPLRPGGNQVDSTPIHLVTTATFGAMRQLGIPGSTDGLTRRLRPNLVIRTPPSAEPDFVEFSWQVLRIGNSVRLVVRKRTERCSMTTWEQPGLLASNLLKLLGPATGRHAGVYAAVLEPGTIGLGDPVWLESFQAL
jgi:uncharacterized protein